MNNITNLIIKVLAFGFWFGRAPIAPGTIGTLPGLLLVWILWHTNSLTYCIVLIISFVIAIYVSGKHSKISGIEDDPQIVIDEIVGIMAALIFIDPSLFNLIAGFLIFRIIDILKPFPISIIDRKIKGGIGIVADDIAAGIVTNVIIQCGYLLVSSA